MTLSKLGAFFGITQYTVTSSQFIDNTKVIDITTIIIVKSMTKANIILPAGY